jgi:hypothetical protein
MSLIRNTAAGSTWVVQFLYGSHVAKLRRKKERKLFGSGCVFIDPLNPKLMYRRERRNDLAAVRGTCPGPGWLPILKWMSVCAGRTEEEEKREGILLLAAASEFIVKGARAYALKMKKSKPTTMHHF